MATYTFTRTREQMRDMVMRKLGVLGSGETASADDEAIVYEAIDLRLKELHAKNKLWFGVDGSQTDVSIVSGTATVTATADVLYPVSFAIRVNDDDDPVQIIGHSEYQAIQDKLQTGQPEKVFFSGGVLRFWPVPDANYTGKMTYKKVAADTAAATAPDIQVSMMRAFRNIVAYDLADDFGIGEQKQVRWRVDAEDAMRTILQINQERVDNATVEIESF